MMLEILMYIFLTLCIIDKSMKIYKRIKSERTRYKVREENGVVYLDEIYVIKKWNKKGIFETTYSFESVEEFEKFKRDGGMKNVF